SSRSGARSALVALVVNSRPAASAITGTARDQPLRRARPVGVDADPARSRLITWRQPDPDSVTCPSVRCPLGCEGNPALDPRGTRAGALPEPPAGAPDGSPVPV